jgi:hypothetical protein
MSSAFIAGFILQQARDEKDSLSRAGKNTPRLIE